MAIELGTAYINILPSTSKLVPEIKKELGLVEKEMAGPAERSGSKFAEKFGGALKKAGKAGLLAGGLAAGTAVLGGFKAAIDQQSTKATLAGLYNSTSVAEALMRDLAKVSKTSTIDYSAYTAAAEALAYMGISGKDAPAMLENIGDAIAGAGGGAEEMNRASDALLKMVNAGKVQLDALNQLSETGVPIYSALAEEQGVSIAKLREMVTAGKIGIDDVQSAIKNAAGDSWKMQIKSAKKGEKTLSGQFAMLKDNVTRTLGTAFQPAIAGLGKLIGVASEWVAAGGLDRALANLKAGFKTVADFVVRFKDEIIALGVGITTAGVALLAYNTYVKVAAAVTKAWAVVQRILNGTMRANPVGIVITALALLVGALVLAYRKSDTFRRVVDKAWAAVRKAVAKAWNGHIKPALKAFARFLVRDVMPAIRTLWQKVVKPAFKVMGKIIRVWWNTVVKPSFKALKVILTRVVGPAIKFLWTKVFKPHFKAIGDVVRFTWTKVIRPAFEALKTGIGKVQTAFKRAKDGITKVWRALRGAVAKPVNFIIGTVYNNGIRKAMNLIPGVNLGSASKIPGYATGGVLPGYTPGRDVHRFYSPTGGMLDLSGGEGIMRPEFVRQVGGPAGVARLNMAARKGRLRHMGGFFLGGVLPLPGATSISRHSGYPWAAWAGDLNAPGDYGKPAVAWKSGTVAQVIMRPDSYGNHVRINHGGQSTLYAHLSSFAANVGDAVRAGQMIGRVGSTGNSSGPHLHFEVQGGSVSSGPSVTVKSPKRRKEERQDKKEKKTWRDVLSKVPGAIKSAWRAVSSIGSSPWAQELKGAAPYMFRRAVDYGDDKIPDKVALKWLPDLDLPDNPLRSVLKSLGVYDNGGIIPPGGVAVNLSRKPEAVFTNRQFAQYANGNRASRSEFVITNWNKGTGYFREIAEDAVDDRARFSARLNGMR